MKTKVRSGVYIRFSLFYITRIFNTPGEVMKYRITDNIWSLIYLIWMSAYIQPLYYLKKKTNIDCDFIFIKYYIIRGFS